MCKTEATLKRLGHYVRCTQSIPTMTLLAAFLASLSSKYRNPCPHKMFSEAGNALCQDAKGEGDAKA